MTTNTAFERIVSNVYEREALITNLYDLLKGEEIQKCKTIDLSMIKIFISHIDSNYNQLIESMNELNLYMIGVVTDYYAIMDEHTDQFHPKYLSMYTSHRNHYTSFIQMNESKTFNFKELIDIYNDHCYEFKKFKPHAEIGNLRRAREQTNYIYNKLTSTIASKNIYELSDALVRDIHSLLERIRTNEPSAELLSVISTAFEMIYKYENMKLEIATKEEVFDYCECGSVMEVMSSSSEMVCDNCGFVTKLIGTVFEDNQFYNQEGGRYKHAGYEPTKHCKCWLERIQARETNMITQSHIDKIESCIKRDGITNKKHLTISQLRSYLKSSGLSELNEHVALIKKIITGITPPQLTFAETQDITNSFAKAIKAYNVIKPINKSNALYYPYLLRKLIEIHIKDYNRQKDILSFIHLQGSQTLIQNDKIWYNICEIVPNFKYQPTDRYAYID